jgi:flagellar biosynthesis/type III secretory pathway chaperone
MGAAPAIARVDAVMTKIETDNLAELIDAKRDILQQIHSLVERQNDKVEAGDMESLMNVLAAKERLLANLQPVEQALVPFRPQDPDTRIWRTPQDRQRCRDSADHCTALLNDILQLEQKSEQSMTQRRDDAAQQLQGTHAAHRARQAYQHKATSPRGTFTSDA